MNKPIFLLLLASFPFFLNAQITHIFNGQGDGVSWHDGDNWNQGVFPRNIDDAEIPAGFNVVISQANTTARVVRVEGNATLTINDFSTFDILSVREGAKLTINSILIVGKQGAFAATVLFNIGIIDNNTAVKINGSANNFGTINNRGSFEVTFGSDDFNNSDFNNRNRGIVHNFATFTVGECRNENLITNHPSGTLRIQNSLTNQDTLQNNGTVEATFINNEKGTAANGLLGVTINAGTINLVNDIKNEHIFDNQSTGVIKGTNLASIFNSKKFINRGTLEEVTITNIDTFLNTANSLIKIVGKGNISNSGKLFDNAGKIEIGSTTQIGQTIFNEKDGIFKNGSTGVMEFINLETILNITTFLSIADGSSFENAGMMKANLVPIAKVNVPNTTFQLSLMDNAGSFKNLAGGTLDLTGQNDFTTGILNKKNIENAGVISVGNTQATVKNAGILNQGTFINQNSGAISVNNAEQAGILNESFFENRGGDMNIGFTQTVKVGIHNKSIFRHLSNGELSGFIRIQKTLEEGILTDLNSSFTNESIIRIGESPNGSIGANGVDASGNFFNRAAGNLLIENIQSTVLAGLSGQVTNEGKIEIKNAATSLSVLTFELKNEPCGKIIVDNRLRMDGGIFTNNGFLEITKAPTSPHSIVNGGQLTNNGIIEDALGTLNGLPVTNNGFLIRPDFTFVNHDPVVDLFEVGAFEGNYTFGPEVTDGSGEPVGNFVGLRSIDLINPLAVGSTNLTFTVKDDDGGCFEDITFPLEVFPTFSCTTTPTNATNGQKNGSINLSFEGGTFPIDFLWISEAADTFMTQNLSNIGPGRYDAFLTDASGRTTTCSATVGMTSSPKNCSTNNTMFWDGGVILENGSPKVDDNGDIIFQGDGVNWNDPFNWNTDEVPTANDVVGASTVGLGTHGEGRDKITLNVDATIEGGNIGLELTIPSGKRLTVNCELAFTAGPKIDGTLKGNAATVRFISDGAVNKGTIDMMGSGANQALIQINSTFTNEGTILANNLVKGRGALISGGITTKITNSGDIILLNAESGLTGNLINQASGTILIESTTRGLTGDVENFGKIEMGFNSQTGVIETGIKPRSLVKGVFLNRPSGIVDIRQAEVGIEMEPKDSFVNQGFLQIGEVPNTRTASAVKTGIINEEGVFINEKTLNISNFTEKGIHIFPNRAQISSNKTAAFFTNKATGVIEIAGNLKTNGATIADVGVINENSRFHNEGDLFIKDIGKTGIENFAHQGNESDIADDEFLNTGTISLNFIGLGINGAAAQGIHNKQNATFINDGDILVGTINGNFTVGGKIKGVGIYTNTFAFQGTRDTSKFVNNSLIKIDNVIAGGNLDNIATGHGILSRQTSSRQTAENPNFINRGTLQIGGHKAIKKAGIRLENSSSFIGTQQVFLNEASGIISINQTGSHGLHLGGQRLPTIFHNNGKLDIGNQITVEGNGILVDNGFFKQFPNRTMTINATKGQGIEVRGDIKNNRNFDAIFENEGIINIGNAARIDQNGLLLSVAEKGNANAEAEFNNRGTGILRIDRVEKSGIKMVERLTTNDGEVKLRNENIIEIGLNTPANDAIPEHGMDAQKGLITFTNTANLKIDNVKKHGWRQELETASLRGTIMIGSTHGIGEDGFHVVTRGTRVFDRSNLTIQKAGNHGIFVSQCEYSNLEGGIKVDEVGDVGISVVGVFQNEGEFTNEDIIEIGHNEGMVAGIKLEEAATFNNNGIVDVKNAIFAGVSTVGKGFNRGTFNNNFGSLVLLDDCEVGVLNESGIFRNNADGEVKISNYTTGIFNIKTDNNSNPSFTNAGKLEVKNTPSNGDDFCLANLGTAFFTNDNCGETLFFGKFSNPEGGTIRNRGFLRFRPVTNNANLITNEGAFTNDGLIEDVQQRLDGNSIINNEVLLHPSCFGDGLTGVIKNPIQFGANNNFTIGTTWTAAGAGNGTFSKVNSEVIFAAPRPNGNFIANLSATQTNAGNCVLNNLQIGLSMLGQGNGIATNAGPDQLNVCDTTVTLAGNNPPAGATGTWSFVNAADGQGVIENVNNPTSKFRGTLGQSYTLQWRLLADCGSGTDQVVISFETDADGDLVCDSQDQCPGQDDSFGFTEANNPDFCQENGNQPCTVNNLAVNDNPIATGTYHAIQNLTSTGTVAANTTVTFKAGTSITLQAGFQAVAGSNFAAMLEACSNTKIAEMVTDNLPVIPQKNHPTVQSPPTATIYPNPVQSQANIVLHLPETATVQLSIYDLNGRKMVNILPNTTLSAGQHTYQWNSDEVVGGMYFLVLNGQSVQKLVVVK